MTSGEWPARQSSSWASARAASSTLAAPALARRPRSGPSCSTPGHEADGLAPNDDPSTWVERLRHETGDLLLAGHMPHLARLAGALLTGDADRPVITFRPGGLVGLERDDTRWAAWVVLPPDGAR